MKKITSFLFFVALCLMTTTIYAQLTDGSGYKIFCAADPVHGIYGSTSFSWDGAQPAAYYKANNITERGADVWQFETAEAKFIKTSNSGLAVCDVIASSESTSYWKLIPDGEAVGGIQYYILQNVGRSDRYMYFYADTKQLCTNQVTVPTDETRNYYRIGFEIDNSTPPEPVPILSVSPASLTFSSSDLSKNISVTSSNLTGDITFGVPAGITLSGTNVVDNGGNYSIASTNANGSNTVTVTATGSVNGTLTISSAGAVSKNISIAFTTTPPPPPSGAQRVIFDADMSSDWDDIGDFAVLHGLADLGEIEIIACMSSSTNGGTPLCMSAINTYYGRPDIPCARHSNSGGVGAYPAQIASEYPHPLYNTYTDCPVAVDLYRQVLVAQPDKSVVIVTAGYLDNLHELMLSGPDQYSPLTGMELIIQKVKLWACAGGGYPGPWGEFNFTVSPVAAEYVVNNWPVAMSAVGFDLGNPVMTGLYLPATPADNPIRRVYVDIKKTEGGTAPAYPHPTWTQQIMYYTLRGAEGESTFGKVDYGYNYCQPDATNQWITTGTDPTGDQEQLYITELQRFATQESLEALVTNSGWPASKGTIAPPNQPSNIRATVTGNNINLVWADNSWNETGFTIERRIDNGNFTHLADVEANVKTYSDTKPACNYVSYRIKANNALGSSEYTYSYLYDSWTEINLSQPGTPPSPALYHYYQPQHLRWNRGTVGLNHLVINNHSTHGQDLTINLQVGASNNGGTFYVYFFYQDANNWYRLSAPNNSGCKFEKNVNGTITQIGAAGETLNIAKGTRLETWKITVSPNGNLKFYCNHHPTRMRLDPNIHEALNVSDIFSFTTGKIGLGSDSRLPLWQDFNFELTSLQVPTGITGITGVDETATGTNDIVVYPNPSSDVIYFSKFTSGVELFTLQGQLLLSAGKVNSLDVTSLTKGLYIVRLKDANGNQKSVKIEIR